jgi:hypothetical protein
MRKALLSLALPTTLAVAALLTFPAHWVLVITAWAGIVLVRGLLAAAGSLRALAPKVTSVYEQALRRPVRGPVRPEDLRSAERAFGWRRYAPRDFDHLLRGTLKQITEHRLMESGRSRASADPELVALLGPEQAEELYDSPITTADLDRIVTRIEEL